MKNNYKNMVIEFLLILSIIFAALSIFLKYVILNESTYLNILNESGTYGQIKDYVYERIDNILSAKNINIDIKDSIITEEDIKNEANNAIHGIVEYLKTGENNVKAPDTSIYKQRVSEILHSIIDGAIKPANNDISFNDALHIKNLSYVENRSQFNNMIVVKEKSKVGQDALEVEKLMSREEAEAKVRELLKQKGLTEEEAIKKATEKGITEEQALKILAGYGITIDEQSDGNSSEAKGSDGNSSTVGNSRSDKTQLNDGNSSVENGEKSSNSQTQSTSGQGQAGNSIKSKMDSIANKLLDEAGNSIDKEVEKVNFNKILDSDKFQKLAKITSIMYRMFWVFMIVPIILMALLIKINSKNFNYALKHIRRSFLLSGLILFGVFFGAYVFKVYEKINVNPIYINEVISYTIKHFLIVLSSYGFIVLVIGLFMFIPMNKKYKT